MAKKQSSCGIIQTAHYNFKNTVKHLGVDKSIIARLLEPREKIEITINPTLSNGERVQVKTYIVRHNDALGPCKGGIRMSPCMTMSDIEGLAMEMTWKTSLIGIPFGGGKSGICYDSKAISADSKEIIVRSFTRGAMRHVGPEIYIPAPDMGTNEADMGHIRDCLAYSWGKSITSGCYVTGKPVIVGGIVGRREATGKGVVYSILAACEKLGIDIKHARVAIQGFGNVGSVVASVIAGYGAKVIAVSDINGGVKNDKGLDIDKLLKYANQTGTVKDFKEANACTNEDVLTCDCDILVPAATQSQITVVNSDKIKAKIIAEGANAPTEPGADDILKKRDIFVIPDILCNAGGVFVSYLEYTQETQREQMTIEQVDQRLSKRMKEKFNEVYEYSVSNNLTMRQAAMNISVSRVVEATYAMGLLP